MNTNEPPNLANLVKNVLQTALAPPAKNPGEAEEESWGDHTRTGKVARLPAAVREIVNTMLHDGIRHATIIEKLAELGYPGFIPSNLSRWKEAGYVDWLCQRQQAEEIKARSQWTQQLLAELGKQDGPSLDQALHLIIGNQLIAALSRITTKDISRDLGRNESLSKLLAAANGHFRERTRFQKLQLLLRQYEESKAATETRVSSP